MAMIELVDFNELYNGGKKEVKKSKAVVVEKLKADEATEAPAAETKLLQTLQNIMKIIIHILKDKLFIVYPFFFF
jgi:hypothetical protein